MITWGPTRMQGEGNRNPSCCSQPREAYTVNIVYNIVVRDIKEKYKGPNWGDRLRDGLIQRVSLYRTLKDRQRLSSREGVRSHGQHQWEPEVGWSISNMAAAYCSWPFPSGSVSISPFCTSKPFHGFKYWLDCLPFPLSLFYFLNPLNLSFLWNSSRYFMYSCLFK